MSQHLADSGFGIFALILFILDIYGIMLKEVTLMVLRNTYLHHLFFSFMEIRQTDVHFAHNIQCLMLVMRIIICF